MRAWSLMIVLVVAGLAFSTSPLISDLMARDVDPVPVKNNKCCDPNNCTEIPPASNTTCDVSGNCNASGCVGSATGQARCTVCKTKEEKNCVLKPGQSQAFTVHNYTCKASSAGCDDGEAVCSWSQQPTTVQIQTPLCGGDSCS